MKEKTATPQTTLQEENVGVVITAGDPLQDIKEVLTQIRKSKGIYGYILRSSTLAVVDVEDNAKLSQFALYSYVIQQSGDALAQQFQLSDVGNIVVEGKKFKVLCLAKGEIRIDVFMDKSVDHETIAKQLCP